MGSREAGSSAEEALVVVADEPRPAADTRRGSGWWRWRRAAPVALVVVAVVVVSVLLALPVSAPAPEHAGVATFAPAADHLACVRDATWSPDGRSVALLGYAGGCPQMGPDAARSSGNLVVYDADSGAIRTQAQPDAAILRALAHSQGDAQPPVIEYQTLLWRPADAGNGAALAIAFSAVYGADAQQAPQQAQDRTLEGLLLMDADGTHPVVFTHVLAPGESADGEWDLHSGAYDDLPAKAPQPALAYAWADSGTLSPVGAVNVIGTPNGGASFSIWQPAQIVRDAAGRVVYRTSFAVWSPDGRYVIPTLGLSARITEDVSPGEIPAGHIVLPVRDAALRVALGRLALAPEDRSNGPMLVSWSPNGRELAVQLIPAEPNADPSRTDHALILYDTATGKALTALAPRASRQPLAGDSLLRWSPDGTRLFLYDAALGTVTVWSGSSLPRD